MFPNALCIDNPIELYQCIQVHDDLQESEKRHQIGTIGSPYSTSTTYSAKSPLHIHLDVSLSLRQFNVNPPYIYPVHCYVNLVNIYSSTSTYSYTIHMNPPNQQVHITECESSYIIHYYSIQCTVYSKALQYEHWNVNSPNIYTIHKVI